MTKIVLIAGQKFATSPEWPFAPLAEWIVMTFPGVEVVQKKHDDSDLDSIVCDLIVGHSFGGFEALRLFNNGVGKSALILDHVNEDSAWARLLLTWPTAERSGCKSLHRTVNLFIFPRSTGVKVSDDEVLDIDHGLFPNSPRTTELVARWISTGSWTGTAA